MCEAWGKGGVGGAGDCIKMFFLPSEKSCTLKEKNLFPKRKQRK